MDVKNRIMGDMPDSFFHKIAGVIPGYHGYMDKERRRDADKVLRMGLARQYATERERLTRVQQKLLKGHHLSEVAEVDRLSGGLQRFIDRLSTATYGYAGLFDPIKVEAADLDQLYTFDMTLMEGVEQASSAIGALESAAAAEKGEKDEKGESELPAAIDRLSTLIDDLNRRFNQRADLLNSGKRLPDNDYRALLSSVNPSTPSAEGGAPTTNIGAQPAPLSSETK